MDENIQESIEFGLKTMCCYCRRLNEIEYKLLMEQKGESNGILLQCGNCKNSFSPRIKVNISDKLIESFELISCWDMLQFIKNEFMTNNKFNIASLDEIILVLDENISELKFFVKLVINIECKV